MSTLFIAPGACSLIAKSMERISRSSDQTHHASVESKQSADGLQRMAFALQQMVARFET